MFFVCYHLHIKEKVFMDHENSKPRKSKFKKRIAAALLSLSTLGILGGAIYQFANSNMSNTDDTPTGTSDDIKNDFSQAESYIRSKYPNKKNMRISESAYKFVDSINISQSAMNDLYKDKNGISYNGTCSEVAITILTVMYANSDNPDKYATFENVLNYAIEKGYFKPGNGTYAADLDKLTNYALDLYNSSRSKDASDNNWNVYDTLKSNANSDKLTMFNIWGHSMVGAGYYEYYVTWKEEKRFLWWTWDEDKNATVKFAVVNNGWVNKDPGNEINKDDFGRDKTYQLYPADKIGGSFITSLFGIGSYFNVVIN